MSYSYQPIQKIEIQLNHIAIFSIKPQFFGDNNSQPLVREICQFELISGFKNRSMEIYLDNTNRNYVDIIGSALAHRKTRGKWMKKGVKHVYAASQTATDTFHDKLGPVSI